MIESLLLLSLAMAADSGVTAPKNPVEDKSKRLGAQPLPAGERMFIVRPMGYVNVGSYTVPGYYTLIVFSAPWCAPCRKLQSEALVWLEKYPNLVFVDLDVGTASSLNQKSSAVLADLDREVLLPAALLMNPFGVYINGGKTLGVAPPFSGADAIRSVMVGFAKRKHKDVVPFDGETEKRLRELKRLRAKKADVARQN